MGVRHAEMPGAPKERWLSAQMAWAWRRERTELRSLGTALQGREVRDSKSKVWWGRWLGTRQDGAGRRTGEVGLMLGSVQGGSPHRGAAPAQEFRLRERGEWAAEA